MSQDASKENKYLMGVVKGSHQGPESRQLITAVPDPAPAPAPDPPLTLTLTLPVTLTLSTLSFALTLTLTLTQTLNRPPSPFNCPRALPPPQGLPPVLEHTE